MKKNMTAEMAIYKDLRKRILLGEIGDGARLVETSLALEYEASRLHIKSALRFLEQEGLATHIPQCGFVAKSVTEQAIEEIIEIRIALERVVFKRLIEMISEEEVAHLNKTVQRVSVFVENNMIEDAMEELDHFYNFVYEKSHYERITAILDTYGDYLKIVRRRSASDEKQNRESLAILQKMMEAIEKRDIDALLYQVERRRIESE